MLLRHSAIYLIARGVPGLVNFLAITIYTRLLLLEEYGQYTLVIAGVGLFNAVVFQWLRLGLLRFLPAYQERQEIFLSTLLAGFTGLVILTGIPGLVATLYLWSNPALRTLAILGTGVLWLQAWFDLNLELARSQLTPLRYGLLATTKAVLALSVGGVLAFSGWGAPGVLLGLATGMLLPVAWATRCQWRNIRFSRSDRAIFRRLLSYGLPLTANFALSFIIFSTDRMLLGWLKGAGAAGLYAVGYDLAKQTMGTLMMIVNLAAYPLVVRSLEQKGTGAASKQLAKNTSLLLAIALPSSTGLSLLGSNIAGIFIGTAFRETAAELIPWIALAVLFLGIREYYLNLSFQLSGHTLGQVWVMLISALINLGLNLWWIPALGVMGAAYATVISYFTAMILSWILGRRLFPLPFPGKEVAKILLATLVMAAALWPVVPYRGMTALLGQITWGGLIYGALLLLFNTGGSRDQIVHFLKKARQESAEPKL